MCQVYGSSVGMDWIVERFIGYRFSVFLSSPIFYRRNKREGGLCVLFGQFMVGLLSRLSEAALHEHCAVEPPC